MQLTVPSSIERSGNTGKITSTLKRTGGVVGSAAGTVQSCFNTGDVTGIYSMGGIAGGCASSNTKITDCYNWGKVESQTPTSALMIQQQKELECCWRSLFRFQ